MSEPTVRFQFPPVSAPITGNFGDDYGNRYHRGTDFGCVVGTPVYAPASGVVVAALNDGSFGEAVCLDHLDGWFTIYAHLSKNMTTIGQRVSCGEIIGLSGNTGMSTGPHLHWQLSDSWRFVIDIAHSRDPMQYILPEVENLTREETIALINEMKANGDLASTTDVLACVCQIAGSEENTYSDVKRVEEARTAIGNLPATPVEDDK